MDEPMLLQFPKLLYEHLLTDPWHEALQLG
jgi:hypothetical protein